MGGMQIEIAAKVLPAPVLLPSETSLPKSAVNIQIPSTVPLLPVKQIDAERLIILKHVVAANLWQFSAKARLAIWNGIITDLSKEDPPLHTKVAALQQRVRRAVEKHKADRNEKGFGRIKSTGDVPDVEDPTEEESLMESLVTYYDNPNEVPSVSEKEGEDKAAAKAFRDATMTRMTKQKRKEEKIGCRSGIAVLEVQVEDDNDTLSSSDRKRKGNWKQYGSIAGAHPCYELLMQRRSDEDNTRKEMIAVEKDRLEFEREKMRVDTVQRGKDREADMMKYELKLEADLEI